MTIRTKCVCCEKAFDADSIRWATVKATGQEVGGYDGESWYDCQNKRLDASEVEEFDMQIGGVGTYGRCPACVDQYLDYMEQRNRYTSDVPPDWFDPAYAGERWDDDY